ncbi:hypothetical protein N9J72_03110 [Candidatus Gracilibacteria bacterium]|nr:hypothetical protein [Candidatus Gracilibacteria bacterium]
MQKTIKLVRFASKEAFKQLRDRGPIFCPEIKNSFLVTNLFLRHISGNATKRSSEEIIRRLSCMSLLENIARKGRLVEERVDVIIEGKRKFLKSFKINYSISNMDFYIVLGEKQDNKIILISVFLNFRE